MAVKGDVGVALGLEDGQRNDVLADSGDWFQWGRRRGTNYERHRERVQWRLLSSGGEGLEEKGEEEGANPDVLAEPEHIMFASDAGKRGPRWFFRTCLTGYPSHDGQR